MIHNGGKGVDVFIDGMIPPTELWVSKNLGLTFPDHSFPGFDQALDAAMTIEVSAHTPQGRSDTS